MTHNEVRRPQVAILTNDLKRGAELGKIFKKLKIVPDTFDSTESFLIAQIESGYEFFILDITMAVYEGAPLLRRRELRDVEVAFLHSDSQYDLLSPTYGINHLGYINYSANIVAQVKGILAKFNHDIKENRDHRRLQEFHNDYKSRQERLVANNQALKEKLYYREMLFDLVKNVQLVSNVEESFEAVAAKVFADKDIIKGIAYYEVNEDNSKLLPVKVNNDKNIDTPALWLGHSDLEGVEDQAIAVAQNILTSLVTSPILSFPLSLDGTDLSGLLVLEVKEEVVFALDWDVLEIALRGVYAQLRKRNIPVIETREVNRTPFDLMAKLNYSATTKNLISIDLSDIFDFLQAKREVSFNWSIFWKDFKFMIEQVVDQNEIYNVSLDTIVYPVEGRFFDEAFDATKDLCARISLVKYFDGVSRVDLQGLKLHVREIPYSEFGLINHLEEKQLRVETNTSEAQA